MDGMVPGSDFLHAMRTDCCPPRLPSAGLPGVVRKLRVRHYAAVGAGRSSWRLCSRSKMRRRFSQPRAGSGACRRGGGCRAGAKEPQDASAEAAALHRAEIRCRVAAHTACAAPLRVRPDFLRHVIPACHGCSPSRRNPSPRPRAMLTCRYASFKRYWPAGQGGCGTVRSGVNRLMPRPSA